jgi:hypothetical protein
VEDVRLPGLAQPVGRGEGREQQAALARGRFGAGLAAGGADEAESTSAPSASSLAALAAARRAS